MVLFMYFKYFTIVQFPLHYLKYCIEKLMKFVYFNLIGSEKSRHNFHCIVINFARELRMIDKGAGKVPWCMHLYHRIFNSCRIPGEHKDEIAEYFKSGQTFKNYFN